MKGKLFAVLVLTLVLAVASVPKANVAGTPDYQTPPSLMLHSHSVEFLPDFLDLLQEEGYTTITYRNLNNYVISGTPVPDKLIIISIDDYGPNRITNSLRRMAEELKSREMVAVLGLVPGHLSEMDWKYLDSLERDGFEIASHTSSHQYLPGQPEWLLQEEIADSYLSISEHLDSPVSLILPYGVHKNDSRIFKIAKETGYSYIVGIPGGEQFHLPAPFYVGRDTPKLTSVSDTLVKLTNRFGVSTMAKSHNTVRLKKPLTFGPGPQ